MIDDLAVVTPIKYIVGTAHGPKRSVWCFILVFFLATPARLWAEHHSTLASISYTGTNAPYAASKTG